MMRTTENGHYCPESTVPEEAKVIYLPLGITTFKPVRAVVFLRHLLAFFSLHVKKPWWAFFIKELLKLKLSVGINVSNMSWKK